MIMYTDNQSSNKLQLNILDCSKEIYTNIYLVELIT
jgi:hypothetical protein